MRERKWLIINPHPQSLLNKTSKTATKSFKNKIAMRAVLILIGALFIKEGFFFVGVLIIIASLYSLFNERD